ncbi:MAG: DUF4347 domain-containing protein [Gammaproteobacteria bacterium]|jgi:hypothetical protein|nr:DUF4347 domain-containing protein [Gammaproteobacteria bacterium]
MIRALLKRLRRPKPTRPKLFYDGAHEGSVLPHDSISDSMIPLEPRFMFDAAGVATGAEVAAETVAQEQAEQAVDNPQEPPVPAAVVESTEKLFEALSLVDAPDNDTNEIIFIDSNVEEYSTLLEGIDSNAEVVFIDSDSDGMEQIAEVLADRDDIDAIHIIAHGDAGQLQLGNTILTEESMQGEHADELASINSSLSENADILIYGCSFAEGDMGQSAAEKLAELTGADIAASDDLTGAAELGGDWDLEVQIGEIESDSSVFGSTIDKFAGILTITPNAAATDADTATQIANGVDVVATTETSTGDANAVGTYTENASGLGIGDGIFLTTGNDTRIASDGTANNRVNVDNAGDDNDANHADLDAVTNQDLNDVSTFSFDFSTSAQKLAVTYILGTEETATYSTNYNDAFAVIVTDSTATKSVVSDNVNAHFTANDWALTTEATGGLESNFRTVAITQFITVDNSGGSDNTVEFAIGDNRDTSYDSTALVSYFGAALHLDTDGSTTGDNFSASYTEGSTTTTIIDSDALLTQHDAAVTTIDSATITISPGTYQSSEDSLNFTAIGGIDVTGVYNSGTGTLTLTANSAVTTADFLTALKSVTYQNSSNLPDTTSRSISIVLNDGTTDSNTTTTTMAVISVDTPITGSGLGNQAATEGVMITTVTTAGSFSDDDALTFSATG